MLKIWSAKNEDENELNTGVSGERSNKRLKVDRSHAKVSIGKSSHFIILIYIVHFPINEKWC